MRVSPGAVRVDTKGTLDYLYTAGEAGMQPGDRIRIEDPVLHGMRWSKWALDQTDPAACTDRDPLDYSVSLVTVSTEAEALFSLSRSTDSPEIHEYAWTELLLVEGALRPGETVRVRFGDTAPGRRCGHQMPDRAYRRVAWPAYELLEGQETWQLVTPVPTFDLLPLPDPATVRVAAPSVVGVGEDFELAVAALDALGNPLQGYRAPVVLTLPGGAIRDRMEPEDGGALRLPLRLDEPGIYRLPVRVGELDGLSNPVEVLDEVPEQRLYWGDIHTHHGHSYTDDEGRLVDENQGYARDVLGMDFGCESMKAQPVEIDGAALWDELRETCRDYSEDGRYIALLGTEWMSVDDGHHNLYFDSCDVDLASHEEILRLAGRGGLFQWMDQLRARSGVRSVAVPHASVYTGSSWEVVDNEHRTVAEIYSGWGSSMGPGPGSMHEALAGGSRLGFIGSSDNHKGWMGNLSSVRRVRPGLAAIWAPELSRSALFESLERRRTYATTGERILLRYWAEDGGRIEPGEDFSPEAPRFRWEVHGTAGLSRLRLLAVAEGGRGELLELAERTFGEGEGADSSGSFRWEDVPPGDFAVWLEVEQIDGGRAWATPIWLNSRGCGGCSGAPSGPGLTGVLLVLSLLLRRRSG